MELPSLFQKDEDTSMRFEITLELNCLLKLPAVSASTSIDMETAEALVPVPYISVRACISVVDFFKNAASSFFFCAA